MAHCDAALVHRALKWYTCDGFKGNAEGNFYDMIAEELWMKNYDYYCCYYASSDIRSIVLDIRNGCFGFPNPEHAYIFKHIRTWWMRMNALKPKNWSKDRKWERNFSDYIVKGAARPHKHTSVLPFNICIITVIIRFPHSGSSFSTLLTFKVVLRLLSNEFT